MLRRFVVSEQCSLDPQLRSLAVPGSSMFCHSRRVAAGAAFSSAFHAAGQAGCRASSSASPAALGNAMARVVRAAPAIARPYATSSMPWKPRSVSEVTLPGDFTTTLGATLKGVTLRVESHGMCSLPPSRTVVVLPSFSHSWHVASNADDPSPGWWQDYVGPDKPIDTRHWRVLCISVLGSPYSPTNPTAINPDTGKQYRTAFPQLTPTDLARCHAEVLRALGFTVPLYSPTVPSPAVAGGNGGRASSSAGISGAAAAAVAAAAADGPVCSVGFEPLHAVVGCSLGGMQALQFASLYPGAVARLVAVACTGRTTPFTVGIRRMQRRAILSDPGYHHGAYADVPGRGPWEGLKLAREMGTLFYRSRQEFDGRFGWSPTGPAHFTALDTWEVESYLNYAGAKFARTFDANAYLLLSKAMDLQDLGDGFDGRATYAQGAARIAADTLLVGVAQDALIPPAELAMLADTMAAAGRAAGVELQVMDSPYGHDAFLKETRWLGPRVRRHLEKGLERALEGERVINTGVNAP